MSLKKLRQQRDISAFSVAGRKSAIEVFNNTLSSRHIGHNIINVYGVGGVGKTSLLNYYRHICTERSTPSALVDCNSVRIQFEAMQLIRQQFHSEQGAGMFAEYDALAGRYRTISSKLRTVTDRLSDGTISWIRNGLPFGIGHALVDAAGDREIKKAIGKYLEREEQLFLDDAERLITESLIAGLNRFIEGLDQGYIKQKLVIMFDTYEEADKQFDTWMRDQLLDGELDEDRTIIVLAGQDELKGTWQKWDKFIARIELTEFDDDASNSYLCDRGIKDKAVQRWITEQTGGFPYALEMMADLYLHEQLTISDSHADSRAHTIVEDVVERYLRRVKDENIKRVINICSTLRSFNKDILSFILPDEQIDTLFAQLTQYRHVIRMGNHGDYFIPSYVRRYISRRFQAVAPSQWNEVHSKALQYYQNVSSKVDATEAASQAAFNYLYHRLSLESDTEGLDWFFPAEQKSAYNLDYFTPSDVSDILKIDYLVFGENPRINRPTAKITEEQFNADMTNEQSLLVLNGLNPDMIRVLRNESRKVVGYSCLVPLTEHGYREVLSGNVLYFGLPHTSIEGTPVKQGLYYYIDIIALLDPKDHKGGSLLIRDMFSRVNPSAKSIATMPNTEIGFELMKRLGFEPRTDIKINTFAGERHLYIVNMSDDKHRSVLTEALRRRTYS